MADDIRKLRYAAEEIDEAVDMLLETYTRDEINAEFDEITEKIAEIEIRLAALENPASE